MKLPNKINELLTDHWHMFYKNNAFCGEATPEKYIERVKDGAQERLYRAIKNAIKYLNKTDEEMIELMPYIFGEE